MKRWGLAILILLGVGICASFLIRAILPLDPVYRGKRLSEYLESYSWAGLLRGSDNDPMGEPRMVGQFGDRGTEEAITAAGSRAYPLLVSMLQCRGHNSRLDLWLQGLATKYKFLKRFTRRSMKQALEQQLQATATFQILGPRAMEVLPQILPLLEDPDCAMWAAMAVKHIRPSREVDILSLTNVFKIQRLDRNGNGPDSAQMTAIQVLSTFGTNAAGALPTLLTCMASTNAWFRGMTAVALARVGAPADVALPLLLATLPRTNLSLDHLDPHSRFELEVSYSIDFKEPLWAIGHYGHQASNALPALALLAEHPFKYLREQAQAAIDKIKRDMVRQELDAEPGQ